VSDAGCENSNCRLLKLRVPADRDFAQGQGAEDDLGAPGLQATMQCMLALKVL